MRNSAKLDELSQDPRSRRRSRILLAASLQAGGESMKVNLLNLSTSGALLDSETPPAVDSELLLSRGDLQARGRIVWVRQHRFGMVFDQPVDEAVVLDHERAIAPSEVPLR